MPTDPPTESARGLTHVKAGPPEAGKPAALRVLRSGYVGLKRNVRETSTVRDMRRLAALGVTLAFVALAGTAIAARLGPPAFPQLPDGFTHATVNVKIGKHLHTLILDRGRIVQLAPDQTEMTLLEADGTRVVVPLSPQTIVMPVRLSLTIYDLRRGLMVDTMRVDQGAAVRVRILPQSLRRLRASA